MSAQRPTHEVATQMPSQKYAFPKLVRSKEQILHEYPDVFEGISSFPDPPYCIQLDASITLKEAFKQEVDKMLQAGVLKPVHEATPWINSFCF